MADADRLRDGLEDILRENPGVRFNFDPATGSLRMSGPNAAVLQFDRLVDDSGLKNSSQRINGAGDLFTGANVKNPDAAKAIKEELDKLPEELRERVTQIASGAPVVKTDTPDKPKTEIEGGGVKGTLKGVGIAAGVTAAGTAAYDYFVKGESATDSLADGAKAAIPGSDAAIKAYEGDYSGAGTSVLRTVFTTAAGYLGFAGGFTAGTAVGTPLVGYAAGTAAGTAASAGANMIADYILGPEGPPRTLAGVIAEQTALLEDEGGALPKTYTTLSQDDRGRMTVKTEIPMEEALRTMPDKVRFSMRASPEALEEIDRFQELEQERNTLEAKERDSAPASSADASPDAQWDVQKPEDQPQYVKASPASPAPG